MAYLSGKPQRSSSWLPTQVMYGIDCSDPEPANWKPFGQLHEKLQAEAARTSLKSASKESAAQPPARE